VPASCGPRSVSERRIEGAIIRAGLRQLFRSHPRGEQARALRSRMGDDLIGQDFAIKRLRSMVLSG
jgi:hypothetical protein